MSGRGISKAAGVRSCVIGEAIVWTLASASLRDEPSLVDGEVYAVEGEGREGRGLASAVFTVSKGDASVADKHGGVDLAGGCTNTTDAFACAIPPISIKVGCCRC